jgi:hypothetical protein
MPPPPSLKGQLLDRLQGLETRVTVEAEQEDRVILFVRTAPGDTFTIMALEG